MISINITDLAYHIKNPNKLKLNTMNVYKPCNDIKDIKMFFDEMSKNENIEELQLNEIRKFTNGQEYGETSYDWMNYIKFPVNLKTYVMPESYGIFLWSKINNMKGINRTIKLRFPPSLETIVIYDYDCFRAIDLSDTNVENIVVRKISLRRSNSSQEVCNNNIYSDYSCITTLRTIKFYSCKYDFVAEELIQIMNKLKLPYGCIYSISNDEYIG